MSDPVTTKAAGAVTQADRSCLAELSNLMLEGPDWPFPAERALSILARHRTSATADLLAVVGEAREGVAAARDFIDTEPALDDHKCPVANCQRCKRRLAAYAAVNTALTRLDAILAEAQNSGETM